MHLRQLVEGECFAPLRKDRASHHIAIHTIIPITLIRIRIDICYTVRAPSSISIGDGSVIEQD